MPSTRPDEFWDAGCGAGYTTAELIKAGWDASAVDISSALAADTNKYVEEQCGKPDVAIQTPVTDLSAFPDDSFDALVCVGVLYYVEDVEQAYREFNRVLKTGGVLLVSHQNELFDLFTFNRYTRRFFSRQYFSACRRHRLRRSRRNGRGPPDKSGRTGLRMKPIRRAMRS